MKVSRIRVTQGKNKKQKSTPKSMSVEISEESILVALKLHPKGSSGLFFLLLACSLMINEI